jgi:predicted short-subunit dehydrogenase-like oxidoreductase (DUF2520 family)
MVMAELGIAALVVALPEMVVAHCSWTWRCG